MSMIWTPSRRIWAPPSAQRGFFALPGGGLGAARPGGGGGGGGSDPNFANVISLLPFTTDLLDIKGQVWNVFGSAALSSAQTKWGANSLSLNGTSQYVQKSTLLGAALGAGEWAVECWFYPTSLAATSCLVSCVNSIANDHLRILLNTTGAVNFAWFHGGSYKVNFSLAAGSVTANTWHYMKANRVGNVHGMQINAVTGTSTVSHTLPSDSSRRWGIGRFYSAIPQYFPGFVTDFRLTVGSGRPGTTVPTAAFPTS